MRLATARSLLVIAADAVGEVVQGPRLDSGIVAG